MCEKSLAIKETNIKIGNLKKDIDFIAEILTELKSLRLYPSDKTVFKLVEGHKKCLRAMQMRLKRLQQKKERLSV